MSDLSSYIVGILLRFDAEGDAHALDQFVEEVLGPDPNPEAAESVKAWVNTCVNVDHWDEGDEDVSGFFMRQNRAEPRSASPKGRFGPLMGDHPAVRDEMVCPICGETMKEGEVPALVNPRPASEEDAQKEQEGRAHTAEVDIAHEKCAYKEET